MRAVSRHNQTPAELTTRADPVLEAGEAIVRPLLVPITSEVLASPEGVIPGGTCVGVVVSAPSGWVGKRVVVTPFSPCGACRLCKGGLYAHCRAGRTLGRDRDGCLGELVGVPLAQLVEVPGHLSDEDAVMIIPLASACHAQQVVHVGARPFVTVLGDSVEALLCAQLLHARNATVRLLGRDPDRYTICEKWGIKHRHVREVGRHADQHAVFDWTGSGDMGALATELTMPKGAIVLCARHHAEPLSGDAAARIVRSEITLVGSSGDKYSDACDQLAAGKVTTLGLAVRRFRLPAVGEAFSAARRGADLLTVIDLRS